MYLLASLLLRMEDSSYRLTGGRSRISASSSARGAASPLSDDDVLSPSVLPNHPNPASTKDEVVGLSEARAAIREVLLLPSLFPRGTFCGLRSLPRAILLHGPPGTGKTLLVKVAAAEARVRLFAPSPASVLSKWVGDSEKALRREFVRAAAAARAPGSRGAILCIDEIDALAPARGGGGGGGGGTDGSARRLLNELLILFSEFAENGTAGNGGGGGGGGDSHINANDDTGGPLLIVAATNRPQDVDEALLRRFSRRIACPLPAPVERARLVATLLSGIPSEVSEADIAFLCGEATEGWNGADLRALLADAAMAPVREALANAAMSAATSTSTSSVNSYGGRALHSPPCLAVRPLSWSDIETALERVRPAFELAASGSTSENRGGGDASYQRAYSERQGEQQGERHHLLGSRYPSSPLTRTPPSSLSRTISQSGSAPGRMRDTEPTLGEDFERALGHFVDYEESRGL